MFGESQKQEMKYLLWYGEAILAGHTPTEEGQERFIKARQQSIKMAKVIFRIKDEDFAYTPGETFKE